MIAHCQHHGCPWEITLTGPHDPPLCPEHGGGSWTTQRDRADQAHRDLGQRLRALVGGDSRSVPNRPPLGMAGEGRGAALRRNADAEVSRQRLAAARELPGEAS